MHVWCITIQQDGRDYYGNGKTFEVVRVIYCGLPGDKVCSVASSSGPT
jgi:hypothetical protein